MMAAYSPRRISRSTPQSACTRSTPGLVVLGELLGFDGDAAIDQILAERFGGVEFHGNQHTLECWRASARSAHISWLRISHPRHRCIKVSARAD